MADETVPPPEKPEKEQELPPNLVERGLKMQPPFSPRGEPHLGYDPPSKVSDEVLVDPKGTPYFLHDRQGKKFGPFANGVPDDSPTAPLMREEARIRINGATQETPQEGSFYSRTQWATLLTQWASANMLSRASDDPDYQEHLARQDQETVGRMLREERAQHLAGMRRDKAIPDFTRPYDDRYVSGTGKLHVPLQAPNTEALMSSFTGKHFDPKELTHDQMVLLGGITVEAEVWDMGAGDTGKVVRPMVMPMLKALAPNGWLKFQKEARRRAGYDQVGAARGASILRGVTPFADTVYGPLTKEQNEMLELGDPNFHTWETVSGVASLVVGGYKAGGMIWEKGAKAGWSTKKIIALDMIANGAMGMAYSHAAPGLVANWQGKPDDDLLNFAEAATISGVFGLGIQGVKWLRGSRMKVVSDELRLLEDAMGNPQKVDELAERMRQKMVAQRGADEAVPRPSDVKADDIDVAFDVTKKKGVPSRTLFKLKEWMSSTGRQKQVKQLQREMQNELGADLYRMSVTTRRMQEAIEKNFGQITPEVQDAINLALREGTGYGHLPPEVALRIIETRAHIDHMSNLLLAGDDLPKHLRVKIDANKGAYIHRSYEVFENPKKWQEILKKEHDEYKKLDKEYKGKEGGRVPQRSLRQQAADYIELEHGDKIMADLVDANLKPKVALREGETIEKLFDKRIEQEVLDLLQRGEDTGAFSISSQSKIVDDILKARKEIPAPIRALWGEIDDPVRNTAITLINMAELARKSEMYRRMLSAGTGRLFFRDPKKGLGVLEIKTHVKRPIEKLEAQFNNTKGGEDFFHGDYFDLRGANEAVDFIYGKGFHVTDSVGDAAAVIKGRDVTPNVYSMRLKNGVDEVMLPLDAPVNKLPASVRKTIAKLDGDLQLPVRKLLESRGKNVTLRQFFDDVAGFAQKREAPWWREWEEWAATSPAASGRKVGKTGKLTAVELDRLRQGLGSMEDIQKNIFQPLQDAVARSTQGGKKYTGYVYTGPNGQKVKMFFNPDDLIISEVNLHKHTKWPKPQGDDYARGYEEVSKFEVMVPPKEVGGQSLIKTFESREAAESFASEWASKNVKTPPVGDDIIKLEGRQYGALDGHYTSKWMKEVLDTMEEPKFLGDGFFAKTANTINGVTAMNKTVLSHVTQQRNITGGFIMNLAAGRIGVTKMPDAARAAFTKLQSAPSDEAVKILDRYYRLGMVDESAMGAEAIGFMQNSLFKGFTAKYLADDATEAFTTMQKPGWLRSKAGDILKKPAQFYQATDNFMRITAFEVELARYTKAYADDIASGARTIPDIEREVAELVKNTYPTYSRVPKAIKWYRQQPLFGNFVSFRAEAIRTSYNIVGQGFKEVASSNPVIRMIGAKRLAGAGLVFGGGLTAGITAWNHANGVNPKQEQALRRFTPPWERNSKLKIKKRKDGAYTYVPTTHMNPYADYQRVYTAFMTSGEWPEENWYDELAEMAKSFTEPKIAMGALLNIKDNKDEFGRPIWNSNDKAGDKAAAMFLYMFDKTGPGSFASLEKLRGATQGETPNLTQEFMNNVAGLKIKTVDFNDPIKSPLVNKARAYASARRQMQSQFKREFTTKKWADMNELSAVYHDAQYRQWQAARSLYADISAARDDLGIDAKLVKRMLVNNGVSAAEYKLLSVGRFPAYDVPDSTRNEAKQKGISIPFTGVGGLRGPVTKRIEKIDSRTGKTSYQQVKKTPDFLDELFVRYADSDIALEPNSIFPEKAPLLKAGYELRTEPVKPPLQLQMERTKERQEERLKDK
jgi:hypothetical protein